MSKVVGIISPYIKHDENASQDGKILRLLLNFRKLSKEMSREELESFVSLGAYGIFWRILEYMHADRFMTDDVEMFADNLRIDPKFISIILNDFELFRLDNGEYISDRLKRDLENQETKKKSAAEAINIRWLMSAFKKHYVEFFSDEPVLEEKEIEALRKYDRIIPDLKNKLRDIIYTLKELKFDNDINFKPCANWLLAENNLARLVNGEFGKLKHKPTKEEIREAQKKKEKEEEILPSELDLRINEITNREEAISLIEENYAGKKSVVIKNGRVFIRPEFRKLMKNFEIEDSEVIKIIKGSVGENV